MQPWLGIYIRTPTQDGIETTVTSLVPSVFVATKCDLPKAKQVSYHEHTAWGTTIHMLYNIQECEISPVELCKDYSLSPPRPISSASPELLAAVYNHLALVARNP